MGLLKRLFTKKQEPYKACVGEEKASKGKLNIHSGTWLFVREWALNEMNLLRENNDNITLNEVKTAALRGKIRKLKDLLALDDKV